MSSATNNDDAVDNNQDDENVDVWLRIVHINDVYELDCFPRLQTLLNENRTSDADAGGPDEVLFVLPGDFVAPSLLSSLDKGTAMVDCLNALGCNYVCLGNHECDIPMPALAHRIRQANFKFLNTNMRALDDAIGCATVPHDTIRVKHKRIGFMGLLTNDPGLYRPGSWNNARIDPVIETAERAVRMFRGEESEGGDDCNNKVDLIVPLTHESMDEDRALAAKFGGDVFPIILGGHEHEPYDEVVNGCRIFKTGFDAHNAGIIDIQWKKMKSDSGTNGEGEGEGGGDADHDRPTVRVKLVPTSEFAPCPDMQRRVTGHQKLVHELKRAKLFRIQDWMGGGITTTVRKSICRRTSLLSVLPKNANGAEEGEKVHFSTKNNRLGPSTGTTAICTMLRMGMRAEVGIMNAGGVRGAKIYPSNGHFTWSDLKAEVPFEHAMTACYIPGIVLQQAITLSRAGSRQDPPVASGGYLHTCNHIVYDEERRCIETIKKRRFNPDKLYLTALPVQFFLGVDNLVPLLEWAKEADVKIDHEAAIPAKFVLVQVFAALIWVQLGSFDDIDLNNDGVLTRDEVKAAVVKHYGYNGTEDVADIVVDNIMSVADLNGNNCISPLEMMIVQYVASDLLSRAAHTPHELRVMHEVAASVLGHQNNPSHQDVQRMVQTVRRYLDVNRDGNIDRDEMIAALGDLTRKELLS